MNPSTPEPSAEDRARDLQTDLEALAADGTDPARRDGDYLAGLGADAMIGWPAAIRRALWAEARVRELEAADERRQQREAAERWHEE